MKINLAKSAGFCFGVKRALKIAFDTIQSSSGVYMLGDIVHNEQVVREIEKAGIKKIKKLNSGKNKTLLIRAHGTSQRIMNNAVGLGYKIIDATCPMVKEIHRVVREMDQNGYRVIVIGNKKHDEVQGIVGQIRNKAIVIDLPENIPFKTIKKIKKACAVVQSTQNLDKALKIARILKPLIKEFKFFNTVCRPTRIKQEEIKAMPKKNNLMIIIGSKTSANTRRLYEISKSINKKSYWVHSNREIKPGWFKKVKTVGLTAGASTPESTTMEVIEYIKKFND